MAFGGEADRRSINRLGIDDAICALMSSFVLVIAIYRQLELH